MAEKACPYSPPLNTNINQNNEGNLLPLHEVGPPLIVISDSDTNLEGSFNQDLLDLGQESSREKTELGCLQYSTASPWRHFEEDAGERVKECENLYFRNEMPTPLPNSLKVEEQNNSEVSWEDYRSLILRLWAEKYLSNLFTNKDSSTAELPGSNNSNDVPYIIDLLTEEGGECQSSLYKSVHERSSKFTNASANGTQNITSASHFQPQQQQHKLKQQQQQQQQQQQPNSSTINSRSFPILEKPSQALPSFNIAKETPKAQGEASGRPTLFLRSNAPLKPQEEGGDGPSRRQALLSEMPFNFFVKREQDKPHNSTNNQNHKFSLSDPRDKEETPRNPSPPSPPPFQNSESRSYFSRISNQPTNCVASEFCFHGNEIQNLKIELEKAQSRIANLSFKMNDQCSHLDQLMKERNVLQEKLNDFLRTNPPHHLIPEMSYPVFTQQGYKTPHPAMYPPGIETYTSHQTLGRRASWQYPYELPRGRMTGGYKSRPEEFMSHLTGSDPRALENLRDRIVALQMQNIELNLFLKKEEIRRKEAEDAVKKEKEYVRKLQESIQDISSSTLIIDPLTYKQVADNYIAAKKKPVRRTHTCNPYIGSSDLVCDSNRLKVVQNKNQSTSCPSSPLGPGHERKSSNCSSKAPPPTPIGTPFSESPSSDCSIFSLDKSSSSSPSEIHDANLSWNVEGEGSPSTLNSHQYQELLSNLDNLQVSSSPS